MAKRGRPKKEKVEEGEQMDLIDVSPENAPQIAQVARRYRNAVKRRLKALDEETGEKQNLLDLIKRSGLQTVDGKIRCRVDGLVITVTPRDELIRVKEETEAQED